MRIGVGGELEEEVVLINWDMHLLLKQDLDDQFHLRLDVEVEKVLDPLDGEGILEEA